MGSVKMAPDDDKGIRVSTEASQREMLEPGALVILSPLVAGLGFVKNCFWFWLS
jgi:Na+/H+-translocating membrane pyrophosphatase